MAQDSTAFFGPRRIIALAVLAGFIVFMVQNRGDTTVGLLLFELSGPLWLLLLVSFSSAEPLRGYCWTGDAACD